MKMIIRSCLLSLCLLISGIQAKAQQAEIAKGMALHDKGQYLQAIQHYKKSLKKYPNSSSILYELAYSYASMKDYKKAVKYSKASLQLNTIEAYLLLSACYDAIGKHDKAIVTIDIAIKKLEPNHLLYYNQAINYIKTNQIQESEQFLIKSLEISPYHIDSHYHLALVENALGQKVLCIAASLVYLMLEPEGNRAKYIYYDLKNKLDDKELFETTQQNGQKGLQGMRAKYTVFLKTFTKTSTHDDKTSKILWSQYASIFSKIISSNHVSTFCNYILQYHYDQALQWLEDHPKKLKDFANVMDATR